MVKRICAECQTTETPMWRTVDGVGVMCNKCGIKLVRWRKACLRGRTVGDRMHKRVESKRYNLKSLTKEFGEILAKVRVENERKFREILLKCCNTKMFKEFENGESVEFSVLNIPLDVWREMRSLTNE